ncbi:hypothetical protein GCM10017624_16270 [Azotobacter vinelandii]|nr:hypothetical protein GCM10017624_16270 [Azotobacter vinelandii]
MLGDTPAVQAVDAADRQAQPDALVEQIPVPDEADTPVMHQRAELLAATTAWQLGSLGFETEREGIFGRVSAGYDAIAKPESGRINRIHCDGRGQGWFVWRLPIYLLPCLPILAFPKIARRTSKKALVYDSNRFPRGYRSF